LKEIELSPLIMGTKAMRSVGIVDSQQLGLLKQTLEDYCFARGITGEHERDNVASSILRLFGRGLTSPEEITAALEDISTEQSRRQA
jgi:hypothetical protein